MSKQDLFSCYYEITEIPMCIYSTDNGVTATFPVSDTPFLPEQFIQYCIDDFNLQKRDDSNPMVLLMDPSYFLGIAKLEQDDYLILGPAGPFAPSPEQILSFSVNVIYPEKLSEFCNLLTRTPIVTYRKFISALSIAVRLYTGKLVSLDEIMLCNNTSQSKRDEKNMREQLFSQKEHSIVHTMYSYETGVLAAIEEGNLPLLKRRLNEPVTGRVGQMANDMLTQEKYIFISFITMITRAAIKGGMNHEAAFSLSDTYCQQADAMTRVQDVNALTYQMALDFCRRVAEEDSRESYSTTVNKLRDYISVHLHKDLTLAELSRHVGLCTRVVSLKFRNETGISIADYIHKQRMREAAHLLTHSEYSITDICEFLHYGSQSYFTKIFKDTHGVTPQQYRDKQ